MYTKGFDTGFLICFDKGIRKKNFKKKKRWINWKTLTCV